MRVCRRVNTRCLYVTEVFLVVIGVRGFVPSLGDERVSVGVRKGVQLPVRDPFYALFVTAILNNIGYKSSNYGQTYCGQVGLA